MGIIKLELTDYLQPIFDSVFKDILDEEYLTPELFLKKNWAKFKEYAKKNKVNNNLPGKVFEVLFEIILKNEKVKIYLKDSNVEGVPLIKPDFLIKKNDGNFIFISLKTSLRERWKQADWEAIKFKEKYHSSDCYLVTLNELEIKTLKDKIIKGQLKGGLDAAYLGLSNDLNELIEIVKESQD